MKKWFTLCLVALSMSAFTVSGPKLSATLIITVLDDIGNVQEGAKVALYETEDDYNGHVNEVASDVTNAKGKVTFNKLKGQVYFMDVAKGAKNNLFGGEKTSVLEEGKYNKINVIINE